MAYGNADAVDMGACSVYFGPDGAETALGYTSGGVSVTYSVETQEIEVDQVDAPISEQITKQTLEVKVPMAESNIARLQALLPGTTLVVDGFNYKGIYSAAASYVQHDAVLYEGDLYSAGAAVTGDPVDGTGWTAVPASTKVKMNASGAAGDLNEKAASLVLKPDEDDENTWLTLHRAVPVPSFDFSYTKNDVRVIEVTFKGLVHDTKGLYTWGDETATAHS